MATFTITRRSVLTAVTAAGCALAALGLGACGGGGSTSSGSSQASFCKSVIALNNQTQAYTASDTGATSSEQAQVISTFKKLADEAPAAIKDDMTLEAQSIDQTLSGNGASVDSVSLQAANDRVTNYLNSNCGGGTIDFSN